MYKNHLVEFAASFGHDSPMPEDVNVADQIGEGLDITHQAIGEALIITADGNIYYKHNNSDGLHDLKAHEAHWRDTYPIIGLGRPLVAVVGEPLDLGEVATTEVVTTIFGSKFVQPRASFAGEIPSLSPFEGVRAFHDKLHCHNPRTVARGARLALQHYQ